MRNISDDPQDAPDFWMDEIRRVTDVNGEYLVVYVNQDGEEYVMNAQDFDDIQTWGAPMP